MNVLKTSSFFWQSWSLSGHQAFCSAVKGLKTEEKAHELSRKSVLMEAIAELESAVQGVEDSRKIALKTKK